jgi:2-keto-3-deoxy-L-fuconate dehydrogenase
MAKRVEGKIAFCTAAGAGIGRATAIALAREGAKVIATDLNEALLAGLKEEGVAEVAKLDARDTVAVQAMAKRLGSVDVLFNAAGFVHHGTVLDCTDEDWDFSFDLNVKSMHRTIRAFLPGMLAHGGGSIINIASAAGVFKAAPNRYVYGATKGAISALTRGLAVEYAPFGIRVNALAPGFIETALTERVLRIEAFSKALLEQTPLRRFGTSEDVAQAALFFASDESAFITGAELAIDGGMAATL